MPTVVLPARVIGKLLCALCRRKDSNFRTLSGNWTRCQSHEVEWFCCWLCFKKRTAMAMPCCDGADESTDEH